MTANLENIHEIYNIFCQKNRMNADIINLFDHFHLSQTLRHLKMEKQQGVSASLLIVLLCLFRMCKCQCTCPSDPLTRFVYSSRIEDLEVVSKSRRRGWYFDGRSLAFAFLSRSSAFSFTFCHTNILALPLRATVLQLDFGSVKMEKKFYYIYI